jgi:hypothetical protein
VDGLVSDFLEVGNSSGEVRLLCLWCELPERCSRLVPALVVLLPALHGLGTFPPAHNDESGWVVFILQDEAFARADLISGGREPLESSEELIVPPLGDGPDATGVRVAHRRSSAPPVTILQE